MHTLPGHFYELAFVLSGPLETTSDWLVGPLGRRYPVDVVRISTPEKHPGDDLPRASAVVRWTGETGDITEGDTVTASAIELGIPSSIGATAAVIAVTDLGLALAGETASAGSHYAVAAIILAGTLLMIWRGKRAA